MPSSPSSPIHTVCRRFSSQCHRHRYRHRLPMQRTSIVSFHFIYVRQKPIMCTFIWLVGIQFIQMYVVYDDIYNYVRGLWQRAAVQNQLAN